MNAEDRQAAERRIEAWLNETAPEPPTGMTNRLLAHTAGLPQRTRGGIFDMFAIRAVAVATVVATATVIGLTIANVIGPEPPVGTPGPSASETSSVQPSPSVPPSPTAPAEPGAEPGPSQAGPQALSLHHGLSDLLQEPFFARSRGEAWARRRARHERRRRTGRAGGEGGGRRRRLGTATRRRG